MTTGSESQDTQRIDRWLWFARFLKTRSLATKFVERGKIRLTSATVVEPARVTKASHIVRVGDILTFPIGRRVRVVKVLKIALRRGPAPEAQQLYEDLAPMPKNTGANHPHPSENSELKARRPNKRERRALLDLKNSPPTYRGNS